MTATHRTSSDHCECGKTNVFHASGSQLVAAIIPVSSAPIGAAVVPVLPLTAEPLDSDGGWPWVRPGWYRVAMDQFPAYPGKDVLTHVGSAGQPAPSLPAQHLPFRSRQGVMSGRPHLMSYCAVMRKHIYG